MFILKCYRGKQVDHAYCQIGYHDLDQVHCGGDEGNFLAPTTVKVIFGSTAKVFSDHLTVVFAQFIFKLSKLWQATTGKNIKF